MVFVNSIDELSYYHSIPGVPCYCESIIFPNDMILQAPLNWNGSGTYTLEIQLYAPDGVTLLNNDVEPYFRYYFFVNPTTGEHTFTLQLNSFAPEMCTNACYVLHVVIADGGSEIFNKWTEQYCQNDCCDYPRGITAIQGEVVSNNPVSPSPDVPKVSRCGDTYITLRTYNDCYDAQTGKYYGEPSNILSGTAFSYHDLTNFIGIIQQVPREIERTYSFNCRLQRVQSTRLYSMKSMKTAFPAWKMNEIENQLHAQHIFVEDVQYEFNGGSVFDTIRIPGSCENRYNLVTQLNDCNIFQIHGCGTNCTTSVGTNMSFIVVNNGDAFYNDNKQLIGTTPEEVTNYFTNLPNVESVTVLDSMDYDCTFNYGITVEATGFVPNSIYAGGTSPSNRVYSLTDAQLADVCTYIVVPCGQVTIGTITIEDVSCDTVVIGTIEVEDMPSTDIGLYPINGWVDEGDTTASISNGAVSITLDLSNVSYPYSGSPATLPAINEVIGTIDELGRPMVDVSFMFPDFSIVITMSGNIYYTGYPTSADLEASYINVNLSYNNG